MTDRLSGVKTLRTHVNAVLDTVAAEDAEGVVQVRQSIIGRRVATVSEEPVGLQQTGRANKSVWIPPE